MSESLRQLREYLADRVFSFPEFVTPGDLDNDGDLDFIMLFAEGNLRVVLLRK